VLIWCANLLHGGSRQNNPRLTRWSQVTHYYFDDCIYYTPAFSDEALGRLDLRNLVAISDGLARPNSYLGEVVASWGACSTSFATASVDEAFARCVVQDWLSDRKGCFKLLISLPGPLSFARQAASLILYECLARETRWKRHRQILEPLPG
jgi:hypothetical protein